MEYNPNYFDGSNLLQMKPKKTAIRTFILREGIIVGMFQGSRGQRPDLDFVIKILRPGLNSKAEPPLHIYWVVDLMFKVGKYKNEIREIVKFYLEFYDNAIPFENTEERDNYELRTVDHILESYGYIEPDNTLSIEYACIVLELFVFCEKRNTGAYMFRDLLGTLLDYIDGKADYMHVLKAAQPGFR